VTLIGLVQRRLVTSPMPLALQSGITISGAGNLMARAAEARLVEFTGRQAWQTDIISDLARAFGFQKRSRGRPKAPAQPVVALDPAHDAIRAEMRQLGDISSRNNVPVPLSPAAARATGSRWPSAARRALRLPCPAT